MSCIPHNSLLFCIFGVFVQKYQCLLYLVTGKEKKPQVCDPSSKERFVVRALDKYIYTHINVDLILYIYIYLFKGRK